MKIPGDNQLNGFIEMFGDVLPDPKHEPIKFLYYWRLYLLKEGLLNESVNPRR